MTGITFDKLSKKFGAVEALRAVDLTVAQGEFIALIGPSGCGKTTMLRHVLGLESPTEGSVLVGGRDPEKARQDRDLGFVFQKAALVPSITALENVRLTLEVTGVKHGLDPEALLDDFGLGNFKDHYPHQLSGGMQQRVNIAAALVHNPQYLMMDEPFGALDEMTKETMAEWLEGVLAKSRKTIILVTHSIEEAVMLADRVVILRPRPGEIDSIISIDLPHPRHKTLKTTERFSEFVMEVRRQLYKVEEIT